MLPFVRGGDAGPEVPDSAVGESKGRGAPTAGHRSELQRRPDAGPSAYALLRALNALRNPAFSGPWDLSPSKPLHSRLHPRPPAAHSLTSVTRTLAFQGVGGRGKIKTSLAVSVLRYESIMTGGGVF